MDIIQTVNVLLAPMGCLILILVDCLSNRTTNRTQRNLLVYILLFALGAMAAELWYDIFAGRVDRAAYINVRIANFFFFFCQTASFSGIVMLMVSYGHQDRQRMQRLRGVVVTICAASALLLIINLLYPFLYVFTEDNQYVRGTGYTARIVITYGLLLLGAANLWRDRRMLHPPVQTLCVMFAISLITGTTLDLTISRGRLVWPCYTISMLFSYLFIVRSDYRIDTLTGAYNRRYLDEYLLALSKGGAKAPFTLFMADMDRFKDINDAYGHSEGDRALRDVASILRGAVRHVDFVARYGGDEFVIVARTDNAEVIVERIQSRLSAFNEEAERPYALSMSCGYAMYTPDGAKSIADCLAEADARMYRQKAGGRMGDCDPPYETPLG